MMKMLPWFRSRYWRLEPWWTRWCDAVLNTSSTGPSLPIVSVWIQYWYSRFTPRAVSMVSGRNPTSDSRP